MNPFPLGQASGSWLEHAKTARLIFRQASAGAHGKGLLIPALCFRFRVLPSSLLLLALVVGFATEAIAQTAPEADPVPAQRSDQNSPAAPIPPTSAHLRSLPKNLVLDQKDFWTAPLHFSEKEWDWALPSILVGGMFIKADRSIEKHVPTSKSTISHAVTYSNAGVAALAAAGGGLFLLGHLQNDDQKRETGILAGEAAIGAFLDTEVFKYAAGRERPFTGSGTGRFFVGGD
ncbi:MAG: hypothetical protein DMG79_18950, partial [Acidobacteria bacterium]